LNAKFNFKTTISLTLNILKMKIRLLSLILSLYCCTFLGAQTVILDFEAEATSTTFQYFGSSLEPMLTNVIANPDPSGINTSAMVSDQSSDHAD